MKLVGENELVVLNYTTNKVVCQGQNRTYVIGGATSNGPGLEFISSDDVLYINSRSSAFRTGLLEFRISEDKKAQLYEELHIPNWRETAIFENDIDDMLLHPTPEKLQKIIDISDLLTIERVRGALIRLTATNGGVSHRVEKLVEDRFAEITRSPASRSSIRIVKEDIEPPHAAPATQDIEEMKALMDKMAKRIEELEGGSSSAKEEKGPSAKSAKTTKPSTRQTPKRASSANSSVPSK